MNGITNEKENRGAYVADPDLLVDRFGEMVYKIALLQTRNPQDAEDVFQEVFLRMMKYKDGFMSEDHAKAWLIRVTQTCCIRLLGCAWNKKTTGITEIGIDKLAATHMDYEEIELYNALAELPADVRLTLHLYYFVGYSVKEIANMLDTAPGSIKTRLYRGRNMLRKILGRDI